MSSPQAPIDSDFRASSTAEDVIKNHDLTGKTILVTGGYAGLGLESVRVFTQAGAKVIVPARDLAKARKAIADFKNVTIDSLDLADPKSIDAFAERFLAVTSQTPLRYVTELRMRLAAEWIGRDHMSIDTAAQRLGYASQAAFSRAFKRVTGRPPGALRTEGPLARA